VRRASSRARARPGLQQTRNPVTGLDVAVAPNDDSCWASSRRRRYRIFCPDVIEVLDGGFSDGQLFLTLPARRRSRSSS